MISGNRLFRMLLLALFVFGVNYVATNVMKTFEFAEDTINLTLDNNVSDTVTVTEEEEFTIFLSKLVQNSDSNYSCDVIKYASRNTTTFNCSYLGSANSIVFDIQVESSGMYYYFGGMGNTSLYMNDSMAIGKITLPEGEYEITVLNVGNTGYSNVATIQNSIIFGNIFRVVFGFILTIGALIGFVVLLVVGKKKKQSYHFHDDDYYESNMNKMDHNKDVFSDEDPFDKYDY